MKTRITAKANATRNAAIPADLNAASFPGYRPVDLAGIGPSTIQALHRLLSYLNETLCKSSTFYPFEGKIAFNQRNWYRLEIEPSKFEKLVAQAEVELPFARELVPTRLRQLAGEDIGYSNKINLIAALVANDDRDLRMKMVQFLSVDLPETQLLKAIPFGLKKLLSSEEVTAIINSRKKAMAEMRPIRKLEGYVADGEGATTIGDAGIAVRQVMNRFTSHTATILSARFPLAKLCGAEGQD